MIGPSSVPSFAPHVHYRFDRVRGQWVVLAPERVLVPDEVAVEILKLVDGRRSAEQIAQGLAAVYDASPEEILADVLELLQDLATKGVVR
jgi:pyrroloquinoline quinone biosynthesis protein D